MNKLVVSGLAFIGALSLALSLGGGGAQAHVAQPQKPKETEKQSTADEERKRLMRELAKKGGQKSVEARRKRKAEREASEKKSDDVPA